jgi:hypothetical protein
VSFKPEVKTNDPDWHGNRVRTETREEAEAYVANLAMRWTSVSDTRVIETEDVVTACFTDGKLTFIR